MTKLTSIHCLLTNNYLAGNMHEQATLLMPSKALALHLALTLWLYLVLNVVTKAIAS